MTIYRDTVWMYLVGLVLNIPGRSLAFSAAVCFTDFSGVWFDLCNSFPSHYVATIAASWTVWFQVSPIWKDRGFPTVVLYFCNVLSLSPLICKGLDCCVVAALVCPFNFFFFKCMYFFVVLFSFFSVLVRNREIRIIRSQSTGLKKIALLWEHKVLGFPGT